ncbi:uncharacterized protein PV06_05245 [Exophiala oligosperma]|uniref:Myb-like domain-containing protein n=1 Tax=Exophiala oligosperma TaxID=215243 RepID=A0A0D2DMN4_9EURO|nr:uncharacterized protein PV06_05245 [Exophiala oligosperma]KIW44218.1 hypothetical protein PV06_05245 [Exophiala oligosperma]
MSPRRARATKRNLVRWTDDLDKEVLLVVQYACAEAGIKIPWGRVAEIMGPHFTEGAIVQHLAKLRTLMAKLEIPVPPALKRGMLTKTPSKVYGNVTPKRTFDRIEPLYTGSPNANADTRSVYEKAASIKVEEDGSPTPQGKGRMRTGGRTRNMSDDDDDEEDDDPVPETLYDSDASPKKKRRATKSKKVDTSAVDLPATPERKVEESGESSISTIEQSTGPSRRTRGIKRDYTLMDPVLDDMDADVDQDDDDSVAGNDDSSDPGEESAMPAGKFQDFPTLAPSDIDIMATVNVNDDLPHLGSDIFGENAANINAPNVDPFTGVSGWHGVAGMFASMPAASFPPGTVNGAALWRPNSLYNQPEMNLQNFDMPLALGTGPMEFAPELFRQYSVDSSYQTSRNDSVATGMSSFTSASESQQDRPRARLAEAATFKVDNLDDFSLDPQEKPGPVLNEHWNEAFSQDMDEFASTGKDFSV